MTLQEIKTAVDNGLTVHWKNELYVVTKGKSDYYIVCTSNNYVIGLTWQGEVTMNGKEEDFFIAKPKIKVRDIKDLKVGDVVTFDTDKVEEFKWDTRSTDKAVQDYQKLVLAGVNQIGTAKEIGRNLTTVSYEDGWDLPIPTKYLVILG